MIHIASLLHDRLGYGRPAAGSGRDAEQEHHYREALDILLGDYFFSKASRVIVEDGETRVIEEHIRTSLESAETQARLVSLDEELDKVEPATCFGIVADKVSLLLALGLRAGAILGKASRDEEEALSDYGFYLGRVVRILEDLTLWERASCVSSPLPPDTRFNHPLILLWEREGRKAWEEASRQINASDHRSLETLQALLHDQGYLTASKRAAFGFAEQALGRLHGLEPTEEVRLLEAIARFYFSPGQLEGQEVTL
jgi:octaprenyl-diphosphate synthase